MAKVTEKRPDGSTVIVVPAADAAELDVGGEVDVRPAAGSNAVPWPVGALADKLPPIEIADIKAAHQEALLGKAE
jgi:hypothetical protein